MAKCPHCGKKIPSEIERTVRIQANGNVVLFVFLICVSLVFLVLGC